MISAARVRARRGKREAIVSFAPDRIVIEHSCRSRIECSEQDRPKHGFCRSLQYLVVLNGQFIVSVRQITRPPVGWATGGLIISGSVRLRAVLGPPGEQVGREVR